MKRHWGQLRRRANIIAALLAAMTIVSGACSGGGPVRVVGVVTGKHRIASQEISSKGGGKENPRYFLWVKTEDGMVYVEVTREMFQNVAKGEQVCINCKPTGP